MPMYAETTRLINVFRKVTQPLFNPAAMERQRILRDSFPHMHEDGLGQLVTQEPPIPTLDCSDLDMELTIVNACMREVYNTSFANAQKGRMLSHSEPMEVALYHLKAQALYAKLYQAGICNLSFFTNPETPEYASYPRCWLQWEHNDQIYFLDAVHNESAYPLV